MNSATTAALPAASTREEIVRVARGLIETRSYLGFSFQDVADKVGIRKASLYHHFPTKEALGVEVLRTSTENFKAWTTARIRTPEASIDAYFRMYRDALHAGSGVCPAGALAPGWDCINDDLRNAVRELRQGQILWLTGVLGALPSGSQSSMSAVSAGALASYVFAVCQGASLSSRMTGQVEDFDEAIAELRRSLAR